MYPVVHTAYSTFVVCELFMTTISPPKYVGTVAVEDSAHPTSLCPDHDGNVPGTVMGTYWLRVVDVCALGPPEPPLASKDRV